MEIKVVRNVLDVNNAVAARNRQLFLQKKVYVINVMSSPGSGKTTLLEKTILRLKPEVRCGVIVGDVCTTHDADRLATTGAPVVQITTDDFGGACHLAAHVIEAALNDIDLNTIDLLIIENVGNLVCPAEFDIGEHAKIVVLSTTEGEDKPVKYPQMFRVSDVAVLNKIDLIPYLEFDREKAIHYISQVHPDMPIFEVSAKTGAGLDGWIDWLKNKVKKNR